MKTFLGVLWVGMLMNTASAGEYANLSVAGDGAPVSAGAIFEAQSRSLALLDGNSSVGGQGQVSYSLSFELPPALHMPEVGLQYSTAGGVFSPIARGWSIPAGMTIERITGQALDRYPEARDGTFSEPHRISGGGLNGLIVKVNGTWEYIGQDAAQPLISYHSGGEYWTIENAGVSTLLFPHRTSVAKLGTTAVQWHTTRTMDRYGNCADYVYAPSSAEDNPLYLARIDYGGQALDLHLVAAPSPMGGRRHFLSVVFEYAKTEERLRANQGNVEVYGFELDRVDVKSGYAGGVETTNLETVRSYGLHYENLDGQRQVTKIWDGLHSGSDWTARRLHAVLEYAAVEQVNMGALSMGREHVPRVGPTLALAAMETVSDTRHEGGREIDETQGDAYSMTVQRTMFADFTRDGLPDFWSSTDRLDLAGYDGGVRNFMWTPFLFNGSGNADGGWDVGRDTSGPEEDHLRGFSATDGAASGFELPTEPEKSFTVRCNSNRTERFTTRTTLDLNGDGYLDVVDSLEDLPEEFVLASNNPGHCGAAWNGGGNYQWAVHWGGPQGFASAPDIIRVPVPFPAISSIPVVHQYYAGAAVPQVQWSRDEVVRLADFDGDGRPDILYSPAPTGWRNEPADLPIRSVAPKDLYVFYQDRAEDSDWWSRQRVNSPTAIDPWERFYAHFLGMEASAAELDHASMAEDLINHGKAVPSAVSTTVVSGFRDLNGDGILDYVDTIERIEADEGDSISSFGTPWRVWFGTGQRNDEGQTNNEMAFLPAVAWEVPGWGGLVTREEIGVDGEVDESRAMDDGYDSLAYPHASLARTAEGRSASIVLGVGIRGELPGFDYTPITMEPLNAGSFDDGEPWPNAPSQAQLLQADDENPGGYAVGDCVDFGLGGPTLDIDVNLSDVVSPVGFVDSWESWESAGNGAFVTNDVGRPVSVLSSPTRAGIPAVQESGLIDVDGDGLVDLVDSQRGGWLRNTGTRFSYDPATNQPFVLPMTLDFGLSRSYSSAVSARARNPNASSGYDEPLPTNTRSRSFTTVMVMDLDGDGALDLLRLPHLGLVENFSELLYGQPATANGGPVQSGALTRVRTFPGLEERFTYQRSSRTWPNGSVHDPTDPDTTHSMSQHGLIIESTQADDLTTGMASRTEFLFESGYCVPGDCRGYATTERKSYTHDVDLHAPGQFQPRVVSTSTTQLDRDFSILLATSIETPRSQPVVTPNFSTSPSFTPVLSSTYVYDTLERYEVEVPRLSALYTTEGNDSVDAYTRTFKTRYEYEYEDVPSRMLAAEHILQSAPEGTGNVPDDFSAGLAAGGGYDCGHADDVKRTVKWVTSADGTLSVPYELVTKHCDPDTGYWNVSETALYAFDDGQVGDVPTHGQITSSIAQVGVYPSSDDLVWTFKRNGRGAITSVTGPPDASRTTDFHLTFGDALRAAEKEASYQWPANSGSHPETTTTYDPMGRGIWVVDPNGALAVTEYDIWSRPTLSGGQRPGGPNLAQSATTYHDSIDGNTWSATTTFEYSNPQTLAGSHTAYTVFSGRGTAVQQWTPDPETGVGWFVTDSLPDATGSIARVSKPWHRSTFLARFDQLRSTDYARCTTLDAFGGPRSAFNECVANQSTYDGTERVDTVWLGPGWTEATDAVGYRKRIYSDSRGRLVGVHEGDSAGLDRTGRYQYDGRDRIVSFTDAEDSVYRYTLDGAGRIQQVTRNAFGTGGDKVWYSYDWYGAEPRAMWEGEAVGDPDVEWTYDALGRSLKKSVREPNGSDYQEYEWHWDGDLFGVRDFVRDPWGETHYEYDVQAYGVPSAPSTVERVWSNGFGSLSRKHQYDFAGRVVRTDHPDGTRVEESINPSTGLSLRTDVTYANGVEHIYPSYDATWGIPNGWSTAYDAWQVATFDRPGRVTGFDTQAGQVSGWIHYAYGADGLISQRHTQMLDSVSGTTREYVSQYGYDALKRVVQHDLSGDHSGQQQWAYDLLGNFTSTSLNGATTSWDTSQPFAQPGFAQASYSGDSQDFLWDQQGRLASRSVGKLKSEYRYDGAGRLQHVQSDSALNLYGYDVDDTLIYEEHKQGRIYRFGSWRYDEGTKKVIVKPVPQLALEHNGGSTQARWVFLEPEGHALQTSSGLRYDATELSYEVLGPYGRTLVQKGKVLPIDGFHGADEDATAGVVPFGVRHTLKDVGMWLQPEPLLYLGMAVGEPASPRNFGGVYAVGNPVHIRDDDGFLPWWMVAGIGVVSGPYGLLMVADASRRYHVSVSDLTLETLIVASTFDQVVPPTSTSANFGTPIEPLGQVEMSLNTVSLGAGLVSTARAGWSGAAMGWRASQPLRFGLQHSLRRVLRGSGGLCFVGGTVVSAIDGGRDIEDVHIGDRVLAAASTDVGEEPWVEVEDTLVEQQAAWDPRGPMKTLTRWARAAAIPIAVMSTSEAPAAIATDAVVEVYDARTGDWYEDVGAQVEAGDSVIDGGRVLRVTSDGVEVRGYAASTDLTEADATWVAEAAHRVPAADDWVLVLGEADDAGHWRLSKVTAGDRIAFQGRVFDTVDVDGDGRLEVRWSGMVLSRVVETFVRQSDTVIDAEIQYDDGTVEVLTGTPEHPFYVPALGDYVELGQLAEGTELHVDSGAGAVLVGKTWRQGDFTVYNFEVENQHNYFVRAPWSVSASVLVHNVCFLTTRARDARSWVPLEGGAQSRSAIDAIKMRLRSGDQSVWADPVYTTKVDGTTVILDGHHRHQAVLELGEGSIPHQSLSADEVVEMFGQDKLDEVYGALE